MNFDQLTEGAQSGYLKRLNKDLETVKIDSLFSGFSYIFLCILWLCLLMPNHQKHKI